MKRYQTPILAVALLCLVSIGANAASLHFGQNTYGGTIGTAIPINLFFTGFQGGTVGTFDVTLTYATDQFALQSWNFGSQFGDPTTEAFTSVTPSALSGNVSQTEVVLVSLLSEQQLKALQPGDSVLLGTLNLAVIGRGQQHITASGIVGDAFGAPYSITGVADALALTASSPEPGTVGFLAIGIAGTVLVKRRRRVAAR